MALTQVSEICVLCGVPLKDGEKAIFWGLVEVTKKGRTGVGDGGTSYGGSWHSVKPGKLRIRHMSGGKKGVVHEDCWRSVI